MSEPRPHQVITVMRAASVLAAFYSLGVFILVGLLAIVGGDLFIEDFWAVAKPFAILFGLAFVVLAIARRIGFVLLWLVLVSLWVGALFSGGISDPSQLLARGMEYPSGFVIWSVLALPLFVMNSMAGEQGVPFKIGPWSASLTVIIGILWAVLFVAGVILRLPYAISHFPWASMPFVITLAILGWALWAPMPFVIAAVSIRKFWIGSRRTSSLNAAA